MTVKKSDLPSGQVADDKSTIIELTIFVHIVVVLLVVTRGDVVHPLLVVQVPAYCFFYTFFEL